ncbi:MAG: hypothetical protein GVY36_12135 [Verrucomicrobia bacterium]|jgi:hypothetical protein|nr:hypothetical protein [Verrucomicrobiota bacterium]
MPEKNWKIYLNDERYVLLFLQTNGALVIGFAVVLVAIIDGELTCVTRYDTAHGQAHRDVLGRKSGLMEKEWLLDLTFNDAFDYAIDKIKRNHDNYLQEFLQN